MQVIQDESDIEATPTTTITTTPMIVTLVLCTPKKIHVYFVIYVKDKYQERGLYHYWCTYNIYRLVLCILPTTKRI